MVRARKRVDPAAKLASNLKAGEVEVIADFLAKDRHEGVRKLIIQFLGCSADEAKSVHQYMRNH
jgi:hypothetical protein